MSVQKILNPIWAVFLQEKPAEDACRSLPGTWRAVRNFPKFKSLKG